VQGGIKSSGLAAVLSFFWCGLGQVYLGQFGTRIALMLGPPVMLFLGLALTFRGCLSDAGGAFALGLIFLLIVSKWLSKTAGLRQPVTLRDALHAATVALGGAHA